MNRRRKGCRYSPIYFLAALALITVTVGCNSLEQPVLGEGSQQKAEGEAEEQSETAASDTKVELIDRLPTITGGGHYVGNREPLAPSSALKLPIGSIEPRGWLHEQLQREADGMVGNLDEVSKWLNFDESAWADPNGEGIWEWEELPYWLKGYGDLGYVLDDEEIIEQAQHWIEPVLASAEEDGYFGPRRIKTRDSGRPDLWPHMPMLNALQSYYEYTGDERVIELLTNYFRWELSVPDDQFMVGFWPPMRAGDNLESVYWLYNRTGDEFLLELATKIYRRALDWTTDMANWHNVNIAQGFREPSEYWMQSQDPQHLAAAYRNYDTVMRLYGQFPGGGFAGDENCRVGYSDPRQAIETCGIVEFMHSFEMLTKISGDSTWGDRCEELAFNTFPAAITPDFTGLHYLTAPNMPQLDRRSKKPSFDNAGTMLAYSPTDMYRCCQHNVSHGWPYMAEELWLGTTDGGLCASLYVPSQVKAKVGPGDGQEVTITEETRYPFGETIELTISTEEPVAFPLYLRVPGWCPTPQVAVNEEQLQVDTTDGGYILLERTWADGDRVRLTLPRELVVKTWDDHHDAVSVYYGPLAFSLEIPERWEQYAGTDEWPIWEVFPEGPWNYGLVLDADDPAQSFSVVESDEPLADYPFTLEDAPIHIEATGRRIPQWTLDQLEVVSPLQDSPAYTEEPAEKIRLVPLGCAQLRIAVFPVASTDPSAHHWVREMALAASHSHYSDPVAAVADGQVPASSADMSIPRLTFWDHKGTAEWVEMPFDEPRTVKTCRVYWYDDSTGGGGCGLPQSWRLLYRSGEGWLPVEDATAYETEGDTFNEVQFKPVETTTLRLELQLQPELSGGILEWEVE